MFLNDNGNRYFKDKVYFISLDEKSGSEKKTAATMLAQANSLREALEVIEKGMSGTLADYEIASLSKTAIMDIFPCDREKIEKPKQEPDMFKDEYEVNIQYFNKLKPWLLKRIRPQHQCYSVSSLSDIIVRSDFWMN